MSRMHWLAPLCLVLGLAAAGCGKTYPFGDGGTGDGGAGAEIVISNFAFSPLDLQVAPGTTVTVRNEDASPHSVTSESAPGQYTPGAVAGVSFDTGAFTGTRSFTIPATATSGTVIPYYCSVHTQSMATPTGTITIP
ncbi:MAG TPA: hypothetical protein VGQ83_39115 [Polyangia bacterium]